MQSWIIAKEKKEILGWKTRFFLNAEIKLNNGGVARYALNYRSEILTPNVVLPVKYEMLLSF